MRAMSSTHLEKNLLHLPGFLLGSRGLDCTSCPLAVPSLTSARGRVASELVSESDTADSEDGGVAWLALPGGGKVSCHGGCEV